MAAATCVRYLRRDLADEADEEGEEAAALVVLLHGGVRVVLDDKDVRGRAEVREARAGARGGDAGHDGVHGETHAHVELAVEVGVAAHGGGGAGGREGGQRGHHPVLDLGRLREEVAAGVGREPLVRRVLGRRGLQWRPSDRTCRPGLVRVRLPG